VGATSRPRPIGLLRYIDVVLVVLAAVPVLVLGWPLFGYLVGGGVWLLQRVLAEVDRRLIASQHDPRRRLTLNLFEAFGRIWVLAGGIIIAGVAGTRADGLTAAVTIFCAYSVAFAVRVAKGRPAGVAER
jgi:hypothetical protein